MPENEPQPAGPQEVPEVPLTECRGRMRMRKVANLDAGAKQTVDISDETTGTFAPGVTFRVGEKIAFGDYTIRPVRILRVAANMYRIETARSAYVLSPVMGQPPAPAEVPPETEQAVQQQSNRVVDALKLIVQPWKWFG